MHFSIFDQLSNQDLQLLHPGGVKMTVLQEDPVAIHLALSDVLGGHDALTRAKTHDFEFFSPVLACCIVANLLHGVNTLTQHENYRQFVGRGVE